MKTDKFRHRRPINFLGSSLRTESVRADCTHSKARCYCYMQQLSSNRYSSVIELPNLKNYATFFKNSTKFLKRFGKTGNTVDKYGG